MAPALATRPEKAWCYAPAGTCNSSLAEPYDLTRLAAVAATSERTLLRHFMKSVGMSPLQFLHKLRAERACHLLEVTTLSPTAIAEQCGYQECRRSAPWCASTPACRPGRAGARTRCGPSCARGRLRCCGGLVAPAASCRAGLGDGAIDQRPQLAPHGEAQTRQQLRQEHADQVFLGIDPEEGTGGAAQKKSPALPGISVLAGVTVVAKPRPKPTPS